MLNLFRKVFGQIGKLPLGPFGKTGGNESNPTNSILTGTGNSDPLYPGSTIDGVNSDFLGDWRSADGWMRFDLWRVRARSRQLERGNPWVSSFKKSLVNNVIGSSGFRMRPNVCHSAAFGDNAAEGAQDKVANAKISACVAEFGKRQNFTTRKRLSALEVDQLQLVRLAFDGEVIFRKIRRFDNDFGFSWQMIDPDYLDHNLNRLEPNGNYIRMGVELDKTFKYPVAYWFRYRRPNDFFYNYAETFSNIYYRVPADEIIHIFLQTDDSEQTRGWPWVFAAAVNLFRLGKFEEAALVNACIGASKMGFFKKTVPDGFTENWDEFTAEDEGAIIDNVEPGTWQELPWNVDPVQFDFKYPDEQYETFERGMLRSIAASLGTSYMSLTGDVSDANFSNLRAAKSDENEEWMKLQQFWIENWKCPQHEDLVYRAMLSGKLVLPLSKLDKFTHPVFTGRRWAYVNPVDDLQAKGMELEFCTTSVTAIIEEGGGDPDEVFAQIEEDKKRFEKMGIEHPFGKIKKAGDLPSDKERGSGNKEKDRQQTLEKGK